MDADGDGQLSLEEFKVLFENAEKRKKDTKRTVFQQLLIRFILYYLHVYTFCQKPSHLVFSRCGFPIFLISAFVIYTTVVIPQEPPLKHGNGENENSSVSRSNSGSSESRNKSNKKKTT